MEQERKARHAKIEKEREDARQKIRDKVRVCVNISPYRLDYHFIFVHAFFSFYSITLRRRMIHRPQLSITIKARQMIR